METVKVAEKMCGKLTLPGIDDAGNGVSTQERPPQAEKELEKSCCPARISKLESDLLALVIDIQAAADAKESLRREELEGARKLRLERLEKEVKSCQEKFEEITARWSLAEQTVIPYELQETLKWQQLLCAELIEDKRKVINDLQQELKSGDDCFVKDLRRQANEIDQMMQRSEDLVSLLTQAYREELDQIESVYQQEYDILLTKDQTEWEQCVQELWDQQQERLAERKRTVEKYEAKMYNLMMDPEYKYDAARAEHFAQLQALEREHQQAMADDVLGNINYIKDKDDREMYNLAHMKSRILSLQTELKNLRRTYSSGKKQSEEQSSRLSGDYKRGIEQYQCMQQRIKHFAVSDAKQFEETWQMLDKEVRQQAEKALLIDRTIYKQHLNLPWARPRAASSLGLFDPDHLWKQASTEQSASLPESSAGTDGAAAAPAEEALPLDSIKELMELLCDELGFLTEDRLQLLATLDKKEQNVVKLETLLQILGIEEEDLPKLADFMLKYQQREQAEVGSPGSDESSDKTQEGATSSPCHPNHILPALKEFLKHHPRFRRSHATGQPGYWSADMWDSLADEAYWESLANVIPEDQLKVWESAELVLKKHMYASGKRTRMRKTHQVDSFPLSSRAVLTKILDRIPEIERLEQQNAELCRLLQQSVDS
ncbi:dynein regulatory complex protein 1-like isoform X2 [Hippocampus zosterae]|uniref:dynein regulatory complex protein 1-like isoform X2 n=1 Tax=Hippocampus zosterae TaxID=109293 RepID=UPI00223D4139|nr:dynein regulatory complex protein 1-like isoform X2 [Hippocampus zosterae]